MIAIDPVRIGFPENRDFIDSFIAGTKEISVEIQSSSIYLRINSNKRDLDFVNEPVGSLFATGNESFNLSDDPNSARFELLVTLNFTDYPKVLENAPLMAGVDCIISLKKENRTLYEYKNPTLKDGGLTYEQAYRRVFNKLIRSLEQVRAYIRAIENEME